MKKTLLILLGIAVLAVACALFERLYTQSVVDRYTTPSPQQQVLDRMRQGLGGGR
jgi:hypothetical protein